MKININVASSDNVFMIIWLLLMKHKFEYNMMLVTKRNA